MKDEFWVDLLFKVDEEIQALDKIAAPDQTEFDLLKRVDADPKNLDI